MTNELYTERMNLESNLSRSDYKIIKCFEAFMADRELPYDIESLCLERQSFRDRINEIDAELEPYTIVNDDSDLLYSEERTPIYTGMD